MTELDMICEHLAMNKNMNPPSYNIVMRIIEKCEMLHALYAVTSGTWGAKYLVHTIYMRGCKYVKSNMLKELSVKTASN